MKIAVIVVIGQHPKGFDLFHKNLEWALEGIDFTLDVFTFKNFHFESEIANFHYCPLEMVKWYEFWQYEITERMQQIAENCDVVIATEQDIWFNQKLHSLAKDCLENNQIILDCKAPYFSVHNKEGDIIYPRLWEGGALYPSSLMLQALKEGVNFGSRLYAFKKGNKLFNEYIDKLDDKFFRNRRCFDYESFGKPISVKEKLINFNDKPYDTMVDFTLYCMCKEVKFKSICNDPHHWRMAKENETRYTSHFGCPERLHRTALESDINLYYQPNKKLMNKHFRQFKFLWASSIASLYFSGVIKWSKFVEEILKQSENFKFQINSAKNIDKWMPDYNLERFMHCKRFINQIKEIKFL